MFWIACPPSYDCRAIPRRLVRVVMGSGLDQARSFPRLLRIPCGFVSFRPFPAPSPRAASSRANPIPSRFVPSYPPNPLIAFRPYRLSTITPRLPCRMSGADFLNASNSMPLKMGVYNGSSLPLACRRAGSMLPVGSSHHLIDTSPLPLLTILIQSHHRAGLRTEPMPHRSPPIAPPIVSEDGEEDVLGCCAIDTMDM